MSYDGIVLIDKPAGCTSAQAVARVRKGFPGKAKVGHAGTLDPMATGLLVCLVGGATRLAQFAEAGEKVYSGEFEFGIRTDTDDLTGEVLERNQNLPSWSEIKEGVGHFLGAIEQVPPAVSAIKVEGKRAYRRFRNGETIELSSRQVTVSAFDIRELARKDRIGFRVRCSKGTYIRSLARDLGKHLGCGGVLASLRREESYPFSVTDAVSLEEFTPAHIRGWSDLFPHTPVVEIDPENATLFQRGDLRHVEGVLRKARDRKGVSPALEKVIYRSTECNGTPLGILVRDKGKWRVGVNFPSSRFV